MIVTALTAGILGLLFLVLSYRVVQVRQSAKVELGDGGDTLLLARIRAHANFAEYVPICLILIGVVEISYDEAPFALWGVGLALIVVRIAHALGMAKRGANAARIIGITGITGTWAVMLALSLWAIWLAITL
jgi:uncharacterized membrane protein YecN with MAPEG domain